MSGSKSVIEAAGSEDEVTIDFTLRIGGRNAAIEEIIESFGSCGT